jgi:hypothetical protein
VARPSRRSSGIDVEDSGAVDSTGQGGQKVRGGGVIATAHLVTGVAVLEHGFLATASLVMIAASWNTVSSRRPRW